MSIQLSPEQTDAFFFDARVKFIAGGEGSGKSQLGAWYGAARSLSMAHDVMFKKDSLYWIIGFDFEDARKEFDFILEFLEELDPQLIDRRNSSFPTHKDQKCILRTKYGATFETISGYDPTKIGREEPDGIIGCEVSRWDIELWRRAQGRLMRKFPQAWGWFTGSFESSENWMAEIFELGQGPNPEGIVSISMPTWGNLFKFPGGLNDPAIEMARQSNPEFRFWERFGGRPSPPQDSVFPEFRQFLHLDVDAKFNPAYPVNLFVDPGGGTSPYAVLFVQFIDDEVLVVDELYTLGWAHEQIIQGVQLKPAWTNVGAGSHVMDIGGSQLHMGQNTAVAGWYDDTKLSFKMQKQPVRDQVDKIRSVLAINPLTHRPRLRINPTCQGLVTELGGSSAPFLGVSRWRRRGGAPEKKNNHALNALAYGLLLNFGAKSPHGNPYGDSDEIDAQTYSYLEAPRERVMIPTGPWSYINGAFTE